MQEKCSLHQVPPMPYPPWASPGPCLLAEPFNGLSSWLWIASLSGHLLQDVTLLHGSLDLWRRKGANRLSALLLLLFCPSAISLAS